MQEPLQTAPRVQLDVNILFQLIGQLFAENYARKMGYFVDASESVQVSDGRIREDQPAPSANNKMPYESMSTKVPRQGI